MKKTVYIALPILLLVILGAGVFMGLKAAEKSTENTTLILEDLKSKAPEEATFDYGEVSTNMLAQTTTIQDLSFEMEGVDVTIASIDLNRNLFDADSEGNTKKAKIKITDLIVVQNTEYNDAMQAADTTGMLSWLTGETTSTYGEIALDIEGFVPADFDDPSAAILEILAHDQTAQISMSDVSSDMYNKEIPFLALLTEEQKTNISSYGDVSYEATYSAEDHSFFIGMPEYSTPLVSSAMTMSMVIDPTEAIKSEQIELLQLGKVELSGFVKSTEALGEMKFGNGADLGEHSIGGLDYNISFGADLTDLDLSSEENMQASMMTVLPTVSFGYDFSFRDISVDLTKGDTPESKMGTYQLDGLKVGLGADLSKFTILNPMSAAEGAKVNLEIKKLAAAPPASMSGMMMMMGLSQEQASTPSIDALVLNIEPKEGVITLDDNKLITNFGELLMAGNIDMNTMNLNNIEVTLDNAPEVIVGMLTSSLPLEVQEAIKTEGTKKTLKANGNLMMGISYE